MSQLLSMGHCPYCNSGHNTSCFAIYSDGYHCFTCGKTKRSDYSFKPTKFPVSKLEIPYYSTNINTFSPEVLSWLYKYYVFDSLIKKYRIGAIDNSVILPFYRDSSVVFCQQRFFPQKRFKTYGKKPLEEVLEHPNSTTIAIVEDYLSAIRLAEHVNVICLYGVYMPFDVLKKLFNLNMNILVWLDPDEAGQTAATKIVQYIEQYARKRAIYEAFAVREQRMVKNISEKQQPKEYNDGDLLDIIGKHS